MHLDPKLWDEKKHLNKYKEGDLIHEAGSYRGSGSQTGPHIKISISSIGADGKDLRDFDNQMIPNHTCFMEEHVREEY
jgi:hypothetical protein